jgi:hypothetical protein
LPDCSGNFWNFFGEINRKYFGAAGIVFIVNEDGSKLNHHTGNVPKRIQNILEGAGNVLGPSGIFQKK